MLADIIGFDFRSDDRAVCLPERGILFPGG
jgi:hypothetical protein